MGGCSNAMLKGFSAGDPPTYQISKAYTAVTDSNGVATFYPTDTGLSSGKAIFKSISYIGRDFPNGNPNYAAAMPTVSGDFKTIIIQTLTQTFAGIVLLSTNILGSVQIVNSGAGITLNILVQGDAA